MELYAADLHHYEAACNAHRQRIEAPMRKFDMKFQPATKTTKDLETRGVAWRPNEIWSNICVVESVLSIDPGYLFGYARLDFDPNVPYGELSSDERGAEANVAAKSTGTSKTAPQTQAKAPGGKSVTKVATTVTPGLLVSVTSASFAKPSTDYSSPSLSSLSMQLPQWPTFLQQSAHFNPNSPLLGQVPALVLSRIPQLPNWNIAAELAGAGLPGVASTSGTMIGDMSGMEVAMGDNGNVLPTENEFAQGLTSLAEEQKILSFYAQDVTVHNAE